MAEIISFPGVADKVWKQMEDGVRGELWSQGAPSGMIEDAISTLKTFYDIQKGGIDIHISVPPEGAAAAKIAVAACEEAYKNLFGKMMARAFVVSVELAIVRWKHC